MKKRSHCHEGVSEKYGSIMGADDDTNRRVERKWDEMQWFKGHSSILKSHPEICTSF